MTDPAPKKHKLNDPQWFALRAIADQIVPPSAKYSVPGGGDEQICKEVLGDVGQNLPKLIDTLEAIKDGITAGALTAADVWTYGTRTVDLTPLQANQNVMNEGIKKASLLIPHMDNVT